MSRPQTHICRRYEFLPSGGSSWWYNEITVTSAPPLHALVSLLSQSLGSSKDPPSPSAHHGNYRFSELEGHLATPPSVPRSPTLEAHLTSSSWPDVGSVQLPADLAALSLYPLRRNLKSSRSPPRKCVISCVSPLVNPLCLSSFTYKMAVILRPMVPTSRGCRDTQMN